MNTLKTLDQNSSHTQQRHTLCGPVTRRARAVFLSSNHHQRRVVLRITHRGVVYGHLLAGGLVGRPPPLGTRCHQIA